MSGHEITFSLNKVPDFYTDKKTRWNARLKIKPAPGEAIMLQTHETIREEIMEVLSNLEKKGMTISRIEVKISTPT